MAFIIEPARLVKWGQTACALQTIKSSPASRPLMKNNHLNNDQIRRIYQSYEKEALDEFLDLCITENQLRETIAYLIERREQLKNEQLEKLEGESQKLIEKLKDINRLKLLEEIQCFKDALALQKRLIQKPRSEGPEAGCRT
ncbi:hypothetical protein MYX82_03910 [Acidobacteria bacterium AH-259-D05]|nr:hypothetical protein [Acidobacteria bacterium AH-259-D05]